MHVAESRRIVNDSDVHILSENSQNLLLYRRIPGFEKQHIVDAVRVVGQIHNEDFEIFFIDMVCPLRQIKSNIAPVTVPESGLVFDGEDISSQAIQLIIWKDIIVFVENAGCFPRKSSGYCSASDADFSAIILRSFTVEGLKMTDAS